MKLKKKAFARAFFQTAPAYHYKSRIKIRTVMKTWRWVLSLGDIVSGELKWPPDWNTGSQPVPQQSQSGPPAARVRHGRFGLSQHAA